MVWNGKQWSEYIKDQNIFRATEFLLSVEHAAFIEPQRPNAYRWLETLKEVFENYHSHTKKEYLLRFAEATRQVVVEQNLQRLRRCAVKLATILTSDIQSQLLQYLTNPDAVLSSVQLELDKEDS